MAYCKIWDVGKTRTLRQVIDYITNPAKCMETKTLESLSGYSETDVKRTYVSGVNVDPWNAVEEMQDIKEAWIDKGKKICYHGIQSWMPGEITAELAHKIGVEFAKQMWGDRFQVVVATHTDKAHIHNHFVVNNISFADGKQYYDNKKNLRKMREISDTLCIQNGLSVILNTERKGTSWFNVFLDKLAEEEYKKMVDEEKIEETKGKDTDEISNGNASRNPECNNPKNVYGQTKASWIGAEDKLGRKVLARMAIDRALANAVTLSEFRQELRKMGYSVNLNPDHKYWTIKSDTWDKSMRMFRLGENYTNERILQRLETAEKYMPKTVEQVSGRRMYKATVKGSGRRKVTGFKALYIHYCYVLGVFPKNQNRRNKIIYHTPALREDLWKLEKISQKTMLLIKYNINTKEDLLHVKNECTEKMEDIIKQRKELYRHNDGTEERKTQLQNLTWQLKTLKQEVRNIAEIEEESEAVKQKLRDIEKTENQDTINHDDGRRNEDEREFRCR